VRREARLALQKFDGKLDLIVHTEGGDMSWVLFNTGKAFSLSEGQP